MSVLSIFTQILRQGIGCKKKHYRLAVLNQKLRTFQMLEFHQVSVLPTYFRDGYQWLFNRFPIQPVR